MMHFNATDLETARAELNETPSLVHSLTAVAARLATEARGNSNRAKVDAMLSRLLEIEHGNVVVLAFF
jgi:hypothetical protein